MIGQNKTLIRGLSHYSPLFIYHDCGGYRLHDHKAGGGRVDGGGNGGCGRVNGGGNGGGGGGWMAG